MDNFINQLIEVDKQARERVSKAKKERAAVMESLDSNKKKRLDENEQHVAAFLATQQELCAAKKAEAKAQLIAQQEARISRLDAIDRAHRDEWIARIVADVIGE